MHWLPLDLRDALRSLAARRSFTLMLLLTLGLGIGATTTIYSFVSALLLRPYPYASPDRLVRVQSVYTGRRRQARHCSRSRITAGATHGSPT